MWLNLHSETGQGERQWCDMWLCPQEFWIDNVRQLTQKSLSGGEKEALEEFRRALVLDSGSAYNWANLGDAEMNAGDPKSARYCFAQAVKAGPANPVILFRAANFAFETGDEEYTLLRLRSILKNPELGEYFDSVFLTYSRTGLPIAEVLKEGMPKNPTAARAFLRYLIEGNKEAEARATWDWIERYGFVDDQLAGEYLSFLISRNAAEEAAIVWKNLTIKEFPEYRKTNWVFDGGFERDPKPSPFDWSLESSKDAALTRAPHAGHSGGWALRVQFFGKQNVDFKQVSQTIVLEPGEWSLRAWIRTEGITTNRGVAIHVFDPANLQQLDVRTDDMVGTNDWTLVNRTFDVGKQTRALTIQLIREASWKFDNKISGAAWLDSVEISPSHRTSK